MFTGGPLQKPPNILPLPLPMPHLYTYIIDLLKPTCKRIFIYLYPRDFLIGLDVSHFIRFLIEL